MHSRFDLRPAWGVARLVRAEGYGLIHAHTPRTAILARLAAALCGRPFVYHVHSPASRDSTRRWNDRVNAFAERWFLRGAARLICVSQSLARHMQQAGFPVEKLRFVPNGVPGSNVQRDHRRPGRTWTLGSVALFRPRKGLEVLITALARLQKSFVPVRLRLVGPFETPEYESQVKSLARRHGVDSLIDWVGFTRDVNAELAKMDLFVLPSLFGEGLPMVVLEAMSAGVPVVGTRVEGVPEAIRNERDGLLANANDPDDLARKINAILHGDYGWSALRSSALSRHAERFSDEAMAAGVAAVYDELVERAEPTTTQPQA
jgi:glycosyltransferase involved in cell wall biosynthesis